MRSVPMVNQTVCVAAAALLSVALPSLSMQASATETYGYADDFSTDIAMTDSYLHSPLVLVPPDITLEGVLMYGSGNMGRSLYFYDGFLVDAYAFLYYRFPLDGCLTEIDGGVVAFDVWDHTHPGGGLRLVVSFEGAAGGFTESVTIYGHYEFLLSPSQPCDAVLVNLEGGGMMIDNLSILLYGSTPVSAGTWSTIKALFR